MMSKALRAPAFQRVFIWSLACASIMFCAYVFFVPKVYLGVTFFGKVPQLYNLTLAQFFFEQAATPLFGKPEPYAHHELSRTYFIQGKLEHALALAYRELELFPDHYDTHYIIGLTLGYMNREQEAIAAFGEYIVHNPKTWAARNDKAWLEFRIGDIDAAFNTLAPVATSEANNPWVQNTYGVALMNKRRYVEAEKAFQNAQNTLNYMSEESWGRAYPGNDPRIYDTGLRAMRESIEGNLVLVRGKLNLETEPILGQDAR